MTWPPAPAGQEDLRCHLMASMDEATAHHVIMWVLYRLTASSNLHPSSPLPQTSVLFSLNHTLWVSLSGLSWVMSCIPSSKWRLAGDKMPPAVSLRRRRKKQQNPSSPRRPHGRGLQTRGEEGCHWMHGSPNIDTRKRRILDTLKGFCQM